MYVSKKDAISFSYHTDRWLGLAVQIKGTKVFKLGNEEKNIKYKMLPGNWLRLDPEDFHKAETLDYSVHLNFAIHKKFVYEKI
jgi:hypothetical protein